MNIETIISKVNEIEATLAEIKAELVQQTKPYKLAFVNFFAGGKSYAYTAADSINEGDIVYVPTASRGNIAGVVVYVERYAENDLPFHNTKTIIGKLESVETLSTSEVIAMTSELAPAIADKEASKGRLLAFLARRATLAATNAPAFPSITDDNDSDADIPSAPVTANPVVNDTSSWEEGDLDSIVGIDEPQTTLTDSSTELPY